MLKFQQLTLEQANLLAQSLKPKEIVSFTYCGNGQIILLTDTGEIKKALKKESKVIEIPTLEMVLNELEKLVPQRYLELKFSMIATYERWKQNNWKDGYNKPIVNWKSKIKNQIPYLKPFIENGNNQISGIRNNNLQSGPKRTMLFGDTIEVHGENQRPDTISIDE
jgi:hypothetical protein